MIDKFKQNGGLLLLSGLLIIVMSAVVALVIANNTKSTPKNYEALNRAEYILSGFVFSHFRLPCPDTSDDGYENCDDASKRGRLPYKTLGLVSPLTNEYGGHLLYAPYRKANTTLKNDVDLVSNKNRYIPDVALKDALPTVNPKYLSISGAALKAALSITPGVFNVLAGSETPITPALSLSNKNLIDFCQAIKFQTTAPIAYDIAQPNIGISENLALILVDPGKNTRLEGKNDSTNLSFAEPSKSQGINYDDMVKTVSFETLSAQFACTGLLSSLDLLSYTTQDAQIVVDMMEQAFDDAELDLATTTFDTLLSALSLAVLGGQIAASTTNGGLFAALCAASAGLAVNTCIGSSLAFAAGVAGGIQVAAAVAALVIQIATVYMSVDNLVTVQNRLNDSKETRILVIREAVYADMRGGVE